MKRYLLMLILVALYACGGGGTSGNSDLPPPTAVNVDGGSGDVIGAPSSITLTANPTALIIKGSSSINAEVKDMTGGNVPDGTIVRFSLNDSGLGTITAQSRTFNGNAIATFTAKSIPGTAIVTATAGNITNTVSITIAAAAAASIEYVSATPQVIGIQGTGSTEVSDVIFAVKDINGDPIANGTKIDFTMNGPSGGKLPGAGGEYIGNVIDDTPTQASGVTNGGQVTISLHSGKVAGPVTIIATVSGTPISTSTATISIGGGLPSAKHFSLATTKFNLPGLRIYGLEATETAFIADRFGNFDLLTGTSVSFYTEAGAIGRSGTTDATGVTTSTIRTQAPAPVDVPHLASEPSYTSGGRTFNPRDGWLTVLATVQGEEAFNDANGDGNYEIGETFTDLGEPFIDKNDDGCRNSGTDKNCNGVITASTEPFEEYIDANGNGKYDGPNGVWDGPNCPGANCQTSKMIWTDITLQFTDTEPVFYSSAFVPSGTFAAAPTSITAGSSGSFSVIYGDYNLGALEAGTTVTATASSGTVTTTLVESPLGDRVSSGPSRFNFVVEVPDSETKDSTTVSVTVTTPRGIKSTIAKTVTLNPAPTPPPPPAALAIVPGSISVLASSAPVGTKVTATFAITGGTTPYTTTSSNPAIACNDVNADKLCDATDTGTWAGSSVKVTVPAGAAAGTVTINVFDSVGGAATATITIL